MKKLSFIFAGLFIACTVFGQTNISNVSQTGALQDATIVQTGDNTSDVLQTNDLWTPVSGLIQVSKVTQEGSSTSLIKQVSNSTVTAGSSGPETATVFQKGATNKSSIDQYSDNKGPIEASVSQVGDKNEAIVQQKNTGGGSNTPLIKTTAVQEGNRNYIWQYENAPGYNSGQTERALQIGNDNRGEQEILSGHTDLFVLEQKGNRNIGDQVMQGGHNTAEIYSTGDDNKAYQSIMGNNFGYSSSEVKITQLGNLNFSDQKFLQGGTSTANNGTVWQEGNSNTGNQYADAKNVKVTIKQIGDKNDGKVVYNPEIPVYGANIQPAFDPYWTQFQESDNSSLSIVIEGNNNHTAQYQVGDGPLNQNPPPQGNLDYNTASINIKGDKNNAAQNQFGHDLTATIDIYGNENYAMTNQKGFLNTIDINVGSANVSVNKNCVGVSQDGDHLSALVDQMSNGNWARVIQAGNSSNVVVTQN